MAENTSMIPSFALACRSQENLLSSSPVRSFDHGFCDTSRFKWEESSISVRGTINQMRKEQKLIDFRIKTSNSEIPCHKLILAAQSDYFEGMFQYEDNESDLEGILDPKALEIVVEYFYTGIMQFEFDTAIHVFKVLDFLQVKNNILKESLFNYICKNLTIDLDNCVEWYIFGDQFDKNVIKDKALHTMVEQVCNIVEGDEIRALSFNQLTDYIIGILTQNNIDREMAKWAAEKWISYDVTRQEKSQTLSIMIERAQKTPIQMAMDV